MKNTHTQLARLILVLSLSSGLAYAADSSPAPAEAAPQVSAFERSMAAGRLAIKNKTFAQAISAFSEAAKQEPRNADAHTMLAYSYRVQSTPNLAKSFEHYDIALKINPQHRGANEYVGQAYLMDKNVAMARKHLAALEAICGKQCPEYKNLDAALSQNRPNNSYGY